MLKIPGSWTGGVMFMLEGDCQRGGLSSPLPDIDPLSQHIAPRPL